MKELKVLFIIGLIAPAVLGQMISMKDDVNKVDIITSVPRSMTYQGILKDVNSEVIPDSLFDITFRIFNTESNGTQLWSELINIGTNANGMFTAELTNLNIPFDEDYWLELEIGGEILSPRHKLTMMGYAAKADTADYARNTAGSGSNGWFASGTIVRLENSTDSVGIGTSSPSEKLEIDGNILIGGKATIGATNANTGINAFVVGKNNTAYGSWSSITGGYGNTASDTAAIVSGGRYNHARGIYSVVAGGGGVNDADSNSASGSGSAIGGGRGNSASGEECVISGGAGNSAGGERSTVGGGYYNIASGHTSTIGGGSQNTSSNTVSTVAGGVENSASGPYSSIGGGNFNEAAGHSSTVAGGSMNLAGASNATVSGGIYNDIYGFSSVIGGGSSNSVNGDYCVIPGGYADTITSDSYMSFAFGSSVYLNSQKRAAFFDSDNFGRLGVNRDDRDGGIIYPLHIGTSTSNGNGAYLTAGGTWTNGSSRSFKENFRALNGTELLSKISSLDISEWDYKNTDEHHLGPMAEDFVAAFDVGTIRKSDGQREDHYLAAADVAGVALAGVRELIEIINKQNKKIEQLERKIAELDNK